MQYTTRPETGTTTLHHDGTVTMWNVYTQTWERGNPSDRLLETLESDARDRVLRHMGICKAVYWVSADKQCSLCLATSQDYEVDPHIDALVQVARAEADYMELQFAEGDTLVVNGQRGGVLDGDITKTLWTEDAIQ